MDEALAVHRLHFAFTVTFHYLFPQLTMGLGMMTSAAFGVYPYVLPASPGTQHGLTLFDVAAAPYGLRVGLVWWAIGMALVSVYFVFVYHRFSGKVKSEAQ